MGTAGRVLRWTFVSLLSVAASASADVLINAGGPATGAYVADQYFTGGSAYTFGTQSGVYDTERWSATSFSYAIPVTPGQVQVTLRFRESCQTCGTRSFRVDAEGQVVLANHVVARNTVADRVFVVTSDATLNLVFTRLVGEAWVNAIEVRPVGTGDGGSPPSVSLTASPASVTSGGAATLTWSSTSASTCTASGAWSGTKPTSGSASTGPLSTTSSFVLNCSNSYGSTSRTATVVVNAPSAPTLSLTASPTVIASGGTATLQWASTNTSSCTASGGWSGAKAVSGSASTGALTTTQTYSLACTGPGGTITRSVTVTVALAPTLSFTATPTSVSSGGTASLSWSSSNATTCTASGAWSGNPALTGSQNTSPLLSTSTFNLTCTGVGGSVSRSVTVTVTGAAPPSVTLTANPTTVTSGNTSTLTWTSTNAATCTATGGWSGTKATSGSQQTNGLFAATTFSLTCTGAGGSASASTTVNVTTTTAALLINAGGPAIGAYVADQYFTGGSTYTFGTQSGVYNTERWSHSSFSYAIPVTPGPIEVTLRFRESCLTCGTRSFRVDAEGQVMLANHVVPKNTVADRVFVVTSDATLNLVFTVVMNEAWVNAIEVRSLGGGGGSPPVVSLSAAPSSVQAGGTTTLTWSSTGATTCTASGAWSGSRPTSGTLTTGPLSTTSTFSMTCSGSGGTGTAATTVSVTPNPSPSVTLVATPPSVTSGGTSTLSWTSTNTTSCTASGGWTGTKATNGSQATGALTTTTTYTLTCSGAGGSASSSATVTVGSATSIFPLRAVPGQRYLVDRNGQPFLIHGDTAWSMIVQLPRADVDLYLENRRQKGFNTILVNLIEHYFATSPPRNVYGDAPFLTPGDFATPNEAYFAHADYVIAKAAQKGILVLLTPAYMGFAGGSQGWYQEMQANGAAKLQAYGQYLATRFRAYDNILWVHGGDYNPPDKNLARAVANGIRNVDTKWPHTFHGSRNTSALSFFGLSETWLTVNDIYTQLDNVVAHAFAEYGRSTMPFFLLEGVYEFEGATAQGVRQQAYQAVLSGASGQLMGHSSVWRMLDASWRTGIESEGSRTMTHLRTLLESRSWWNLQPDVTNVLLTGGIGSNATRAPAAFAQDHSFALIYSPTVRTLTVNLGQLAGPRVDARWYDPTTGTYTVISGSPFNATGARTFTPGGNNAAGSGDWVLVLQSVP